MKIKPLNWILTLAGLIVLEDTVIVWLRLGGIAIVVIKALCEVTVYGMLALLVVSRALAGKRPLARTSADIPILLFIATACLSAFINGNDPMAALMNIKALVRFIALFYLVASLEISPDRSDKTLYAFLGLCLLQATLAILQYFIKPLNALFAKSGYEADAGVMDYTVRFSHAKVGAVAGTFGVPPSLAAFLLLGLCLFLAAYICKREGRLFSLPGAVLFLALTFVALFATYKRAALLIFFLLLGGSWCLAKKHRIITGVLSTILFCIVVAFVFLDSSGEGESSAMGRSVREGTFDIVSFEKELLSQNYWRHNFRVSRGWFIMNVGASMLRSGRLVGLGPDESAARQALATMDYANYRKLIVGYGGFEDVYYVAMLAYYGMIGLALFLGILFSLGMVGWRLYMASDDDAHRMIGLALVFATLLALLNGFVERVFELKAFAFFFWLLAGLAVQAYNRTESCGRHET